MGHDTQIWGLGPVRYIEAHASVLVVRLVASRVTLVRDDEAVVWGIFLRTAAVIVDVWLCYSSDGKGLSRYRLSLHSFFSCEVV